jgi:hypothetical protein
MEKGIVGLFRMQLLMKDNGTEVDVVTKGFNTRLREAEQVEPPKI